MQQSLDVGDIRIGKGMPKICAPLTGETEEEVLEACKRIRYSDADLAEWRADFFQQVRDTDKVLALLPKIKKKLGGKPLLFSFRTKKEGGEKEISKEQYTSLNEAVIKSGIADMIDIELFSGNAVMEQLIKTAQQHQVYTVVSNHDFEKTPDLEEMTARAEYALKLGAHIPKLAVMPKKEEDVLTVLQTSLELKRKYPEQPFILIAMGKLGLLSRLSGEVFGSVITFASVKEASAPGQISAQQLKPILQLLHNTSAE